MYILYIIYYIDSINTSYTDTSMYVYTYALLKESSQNKLLHAV